jgi:hypothetical protein
VADTPSAEAMARCFLTGIAEPKTANPDVASDAAVEFRTDEGFGVATALPLIKAALLVLYEESPRAVSFVELWEMICARLPQPLGDEARTMMAEGLLQCWLTNVVEVHTTPTPLFATVSDRPVAFPVARLQAQRQAGSVCNLRHRGVVVEEIDRQLLLLLDGTNNVAALRRMLGDVPDLDQRLRRLARNSFLIA